MRKLFIILTTYFALISTLISACRHDSDISATPEISYQNDIHPIITANCAMTGCHPSSGGEFSLVDYNSLISNGDIKAGNAHKSKLYKAVIGDIGTERMPPAPTSQLSDRQLKLIYIWIEQGAKNN